MANEVSPVSPELFALIERGVTALESIATALSGTPLEDIAEAIHQTNEVLVDINSAIEGISLFEGDEDPQVPEATS